VRTDSQCARFLQVSDWCNTDQQLRRRLPSGPIEQMPIDLIDEDCAVFIAQRSGDREKIDARMTQKEQNRCRKSWRPTHGSFGAAQMGFNDSRNVLWSCTSPYTKPA